MEIETYKDNNEEKVYGFWFTTNKFNTNEGVRIGDTIDKMLYVYGNNYKKNMYGRTPYRRKRLSLQKINANEASSR